MRMRGFLATAAAAMVCCVTLGCPPAENDDVPVEVDVTAPSGDSNTTDTAPVMTDDTSDTVILDETDSVEVEGEVESEDVTEVEADDDSLDVEVEDDTLDIDVEDEDETEN